MAIKNFARPEQLALNGHLDIIYLASERLTLQRTIDWLQQCQLSLFAIDEAHCVAHGYLNVNYDYGQFSLHESSRSLYKASHRL